MRRSLFAMLLLSGAACQHAPAAPPRPTSLSGQTLPLLSSPALRLTVAGRLSGRSVPVVLDVSRPLSMVSAGCFDGGLPEARGTARVPEPSGGFRAWPEIPAPPLTVGTVSPPLRTVTLSGEKACAVTLGQDALASYALTVDPLRREVTFSATRPLATHEAELAGGSTAQEVRVLELSREPVGDWPLLAARVTQGEASLTGPFVLGTREPFSRLAVEPAMGVGLQPLETAAGLPPRTFAVDAMEVAEGMGARPLVLEAAGRWSSQSSLGRLGPDVWGRFSTTVDAQGGALVLRRPRVRVPEGGGRQQCADASGAFSEEACYGFFVRREPDQGVAISGAVYRDVPEGARLYAEPLGEDGKRLETGCQVGLSFPTTSRGANTQHRLPWPSLAQTLPACHAALGAARGYALSLVEEGRQSECPTTCAFVTETASRRTVCECQPTPLGEGVAAPTKGSGPQPPPVEERELEPEDPH
ncbi:hypothetical protein DRW03_11780 [Corallococcus sp. H22C18031201]|uniref:hypothetical protein n=1 Tax=Citreicoccus inhibens TaxID=2849499 RepID=UPI000E73DA99|nr:hypothetical protein [Citreicoccus inhibens]MBU8894303.1 hypothetical protein [Citreicoccus inhibens]RJS23010.1 hypothetical protein DRW03_11780 [Corallococcus sp. H22C18031201]